MNFQFNTVVLKEKRRGYSYCKNNDKFDIVKNLAKPRKAKVLRMPEKWPINILSLLRKENWGVQKVNAGIARSCRLGLQGDTNCRPKIGFLQSIVLRINISFINIIRYFIIT